MFTHTRQAIILFVAKNERVSAKAIHEHLGLTPQAVFKQLARLIREGKLKKQGKPPKVFYSVPDTVVPGAEYQLESPAARVVNERFVKITPDGILQQGEHAFVPWCVARGIDPLKGAGDYADIIAKYDGYKKDGLIDGMGKFRRTFPTPFLDRLYYLDFYSIERFGKTKLGELILYAKQSQNRKLMLMVVDDVRERIMDMITRFSLDAVGFIPPTVKREIQLMKELERLLALPLRHIKIIKIKTPISVPQKTLSKLEDRIENARQSLIVEDMGSYQNILLIDDAVGSGATLHEVARQIKHKKLCRGEIIGLGLTGSFSGFEVIQEV